MRQEITETRERFQDEKPSIRKVEAVPEDESNAEGKRKAAGGEQAVGEYNRTTVDNDDESEQAECASSRLQDGRRLVS
jgi:hypothetical protein